MAKDRRGKDLRHGDHVWVPARVQTVEPTDGGYNIEVQTVHPLHPGTEHTHVRLNSKQVHLAEPPAATDGPTTSAAAGNDDPPTTSSQGADTAKTQA
jgi:hypothetical protein